MPVTGTCVIPKELRLGQDFTDRVPRADQSRQRQEVDEILARLGRQPGVVLADEVGMGKTFAALGVAYCIGRSSRRGPVIAMVPPNLIDKWEQDLRTFCELYLDGIQPLCVHDAEPRERAKPDVWRYGRARHSLDLMKLLDDTPSIRCHLIFLAQGAMSRSQTDEWVRLALIRETLLRHGRRQRLRMVGKQIHRFLGELLWAKWRQNVSKWGDEIWAELLDSHPSQWKEVYNDSLRRQSAALDDDPVPEAVWKALSRIELESFARALEEMPVRARGGDERIRERLADARAILRDVERDLWKKLLAKARWRSPLLIMDEAHHLKNPATSLARQLQSIESDDDLKTGDSALAKSFDRMLFLTATPFQLGHYELIRVMERFGDVNWDDQSLGPKEEFTARLHSLGQSLTQSQRAGIDLQRRWSRLRPEDVPASGPDDDWWNGLLVTPPEKLSYRQSALVSTYREALKWRKESQEQLRDWLVRHNKGEVWMETDIPRRRRLDGAASSEGCATAGLAIPDDQILPFFLAARSAVRPGADLLGEALSSSYEAFRYTRRTNRSDKDDMGEEPDAVDMAHAKWFLKEFDDSLNKVSGALHPKMYATVRRTVDLWEQGEKVLVFAFYRQTCRALRIHISDAIERRMYDHAKRRLAGAQKASDREAVDRVVDSIQDRFFDRLNAPGRQALDRALSSIMSQYDGSMSEGERSQMLDVMRRFLRVTTTVVRFFPIHQHDSIEPHLAVRSMLDSQDQSGISWREKFQTFLDLLYRRSSAAERELYLKASVRTQTRGIRVQAVVTGHVKTGQSWAG